MEPWNLLFDFRFCSNLLNLKSSTRLIQQPASQIKFRKCSSMSLVYRCINISQNEDHILSIMLALSTVQLQSEIWYPYANVFFQIISLQSLEANSHSSEGQRQLFSPLVCPSYVDISLFSYFPYAAFSILTYHVWNEISSQIRFYFLKTYIKVINYLPLFPYPSWQLYFPA